MKNFWASKIKEIGLGDGSCDTFLDLSLLPEHHHHLCSSLLSWLYLPCQNIQILPSFSARFVLAGALGLK